VLRLSAGASECRHDTDRPLRRHGICVQCTRICATPVQCSLDISDEHVYQVLPLCRSSVVRCELEATRMHLHAGIGINKPHLVKRCCVDCLSNVCCSAALLLRHTLQQQQQQQQQRSTNTICDYVFWNMMKPCQSSGASMHMLWQPTCCTSTGIKHFAAVTRHTALAYSARYFTAPTSPITLLASICRQL
jgi:hypothetical protein